MITVDSTPKLKQGAKYEFPFSGLSTDTKPTVTYHYGGAEMPIANASSFMEIDTKKLFFYDEEHETWV